MICEEIYVAVTRRITIYKDTNKIKMEYKDEQKYE